MENKEFNQNIKTEDLKNLLETLDKKIEELNREEQEKLTKKILSGNYDLIGKKIDELYNLTDLYAWVIDDIKILKGLLENNITLIYRYKEEYSELNILNNIYNSLFSSPSKVSAELYNDLFHLRNHSKGKERINAVLNLFPKEERGIDFYSLVFDLIKADSSLFDKEYIKEIAEYFYKSDNYKNALELYLIVKENAKDGRELAVLYNDIGCCYIELSEVDNAIQSFKKSIKYNERFACAHNNLVFTLAVECDTIEKDKTWEEKLNRALEEINHAIDLSSEDASYYTNKVQIEYELGRYNDTIEDCGKGYNKAKTYSSRKTLIKMRILAQLEQCETKGNITPICLDEILKDLEEIYQNEDGGDKYFYQGLKVFKNLEGLNEEELKQISFWLFLLEFNIDKVRKELVIRNLSNIDVAYYTKLRSLYYILSDEESDIKYRMPFFDVNHMNDPNEGIALQKYISLITSNSNLQEMMDANCNNNMCSAEFEGFTFLKSFSKVVDTLPMWVQYGDNGQGCCVKINPFFFTNLSCQSKSSEKLFENSPFKDDYKLYDVVYIQDKYKLQKDHPTIYSLLDRIAFILNNIFAIYSKCDSKGKELISNVVGTTISIIKYLFKDSTYEHEQEMRVIINRNCDCLSSEQCDIKTTKDSPIPKIYVPSIKPLQIDEVILGPKILNTNAYIPYISMQLCKMRDGNKNAINIIKSAINYR